MQKVQQPRKKELVFSVWNPRVRERLVVSLEGPEPYFGFADERKENPAAAPGFCLGLRKRLEGGQLVSIRQQGLDRVLYLDFDGHDDFGNVKRYVLVFDMAGREQNIGLYEDDLLVSSIIPSDEGRFEHRNQYRPPAGKAVDVRSLADVAGLTEDRLIEMLLVRQESSSRVLSDLIEGAGKDLVKGILATAGQNEASSFAPDTAAAAISVLEHIGHALRDVCRDAGLDARRDVCPAIYDAVKGQVFHVFPLPHLQVVTQFESALEAARAYRERAAVSGEFKTLFAQADALHRKILKKVQSRYEAQTGDLSRSEDYERYKVWARLIDESGKRQPPGFSEMTVTDYYADPPAEVNVPLDPKRSSSDNARAYYRLYAKSARAEKMLHESLEALATDLRILAELRDALERAQEASNLASVLPRLEEMALREGLSLKRRARGRTPVTSSKVKRAGADGSGLISGLSAGSETGVNRAGIRIRTLQGPDGATFFIGGSAKQNDYLIRKVRFPGDTWFHAKNIKGAHVLARPAPGTSLSDRDLLEAARLAAQKSDAKDSPKVEVDYIDAMKVRKPRDSAPGFVTYAGQKTIMVDVVLRPFHNDETAESP